LTRSIITLTSSPVSVSVPVPGWLPGENWWVVTIPSISTAGSAPKTTCMITRVNGCRSGFCSSL
jgi:hypothetical protein